MTSERWQAVLVVALAANAALGFAYRLHRLARGGPVADAIGQGLLGVLLAGLALAVASGAGWSRWVALAYGIVFGLVVMPVWVLAVLIPMRPGALDKAFAAVTWGLLATVVVAAAAW